MRRVWVGAAGLVVAGCGAPGTPAAAAGDALGGVGWADQVRDCTREHGGSGLGTVIDSVNKGDVTGDGRLDTLVVDECGATTSSWPEVVEVFDGASDPAHPTRLGALLEADRDYLRDVSVRVEPGGRVVITGKGSSPDAPRCCPDLMVRKVFTYADGTFTAAGSTSSPLPQPS